MGSPKKTANICKLFFIFARWRCYGVPTAIVAFLRSPHGVLSRSSRVLVGDRLRAHGLFTVCSRSARSGQSAHTAPPLRWRRVRNVRTASARSESGLSLYITSTVLKLYFITSSLHNSSTPTHDDEINSTCLPLSNIKQN